MIEIAEIPSPFDGMPSRPLTRSPYGTCQNEECDRLLWGGPDPYQVDLLVCRDCQKSPAVQLRVLLENARDRVLPFEEAWLFAWARIRWPHDTTHRREWKTILEQEKQIAVWRAAYCREPSTEREKTLVNLALVA